MFSSQRDSMIKWYNKHCLRAGQSFVLHCNSNSLLPSQEFPSLQDLVTRSCPPPHVTEQSPCCCQALQAIELKSQQDVLL